MGGVFPTSNQTSYPPPPPPPPPPSSLQAPLGSTVISPLALGSDQWNQGDRALLAGYLRENFTGEEYNEEPKSFTEALLEAIPGLGNFFDRRRGVVAGTAVLNTDKEHIKRDALFHLRRLLDLSATYLESAPWITFLTARKLPVPLKYYRISTASFPSFDEKAFFNETTGLADTLVKKSSALIDAETSAHLQELISFQGRQTALVSANSILGTIIGSPHRAEILKRLNGEGGEMPLCRLPDGSEYREIAKRYAIAVILGFLAVCAGGAKEENGHPAIVFGVILGLGGVVGNVIYSTLAHKADQDRNEALERISTIEALINDSSNGFLWTVKPLLEELKIAIVLEDMEGIRDQLKAYKKWCIELEDCFIKT